MEDVWPQLSPWIKSGKRFALATVISVQRSSPRGVGACLAVCENGNSFIGSVSAGCVENEVIEAAKLCIEDGETRHLQFGPDIGYPWEVSLSCGGKIKVRVERYWSYSDEECHRELSRQLDVMMDSKSVGALLSGETQHALYDHSGTFVAGDHAFGIAGQSEVARLLASESLSQEIELAGETLFFRRLSRRKRLFIIGAVHTAIHLVQIAQSLNYETIVVDPRDAYARQERFPSKPDHLATQQPGSILDSYHLAPDDFAVALTHDPKIDDPALACFLKANCGYIGALGSKKSHAARMKRLGKRGFEETQLAQINGPVGLDIGSKTPAEIAVSIVAEIIATQRNKTVA